MPRVNSLINNPINGAETDRLRIRNSEYICDVTAKDAFGISAKFDLNPGNNSLWPWLQSLSVNYDQWVPNGIIFEYRPTCSESTTTVKLGQMILATQYDVYDDDPENKTQLIRQFGAVEDKITVGILHAVECDGRYNPMDVFYIRQQGTPYEGSEREYDLGTFFIAGNNSDSSLNNEMVGELWVHYDITLCKKQSPSFLTIDRWSATAGVSDSAPFGVTATNTHYDTQLDSTLTSVLDIGVYTFPTTAVKGEHYLVTVWWQSSAVPSNMQNGSWIFQNKCEAFNPTNNLSSNEYYFPGENLDVEPENTDTLGTALNRMLVCCAVTITGSYYDDVGTGPGSAAILHYSLPVLITGINIFQFTCVKIGENP